jgi:predicted ATP-grasp superfamily ATP-dependent carboligase
LKKYENPAVVIGGGVTGLGIIRNLGRNGVDVYCVVDRKNEAIFSKYCKKFFVLPGVEHDLNKLKAFLVKFKQLLSCKAVLFPTSDITVLNVAHLINEFDDYMASLPNREVLEMLVVKKKFYLSLMERKVPHPLTFFTDSKNLKNVNMKICFPVFIKPSISQIFSKKFGKKGFVANSERELYEYVDLMEKYKIDVMIQEIVPGPPSNHYFIDGYLNKNSEAVAIFARRRLRMWPLAFGNSTVCVSVPISECANMTETVVEYLTSIGFHGIFSAEFKKDSRDGVGKLLEVNARSWWYNNFPSACGVNIILAAYLESIGEQIEPLKDYEIGKHLVYFTEDLKCSTAMFVRGKLSPKEWLLPFAGKKEWTIFAKDDKRPFAASLARVITSFIRH